MTGVLNIFLIIINCGKLPVDIENHSPSVGNGAVGIRAKMIDILHDTVSCACTKKKRPVKNVGVSAVRSDLDLITQSIFWSTFSARLLSSTFARLIVAIDSDSPIPRPTATTIVYVCDDHDDDNVTNSHLDGDC